MLEEYLLERLMTCPVCSLYMREGVTLKTHLNTHPKSQVIAALAKISAEEVRCRLASAARERSATQEFPASGRAAPSASAQIAQPGSSHQFNTAISYRQFLSSNSVSQNVCRQFNAAISYRQFLSSNSVVQNISMQQHIQQLLLNALSPTLQQTYIHPLISPPPGIFSQANIAPQTTGVSPASLALNIPFTNNLATEFSPTSSEPQQTFQTTLTSDPSTASQVIPLVAKDASCNPASSSVIASSIEVSATASTSEGNQTSDSLCSNSVTNTPSVREEEQQTDSHTENNELNAAGTTTTTACHSVKDETMQITKFDGIPETAGPSGLEKNKSKRDNEKQKGNSENSRGIKTENVNTNENVNNETKELPLVLKQNLKAASRHLASNAQVILENGATNNAAGEPPTLAEDAQSRNVRWSSNADSLSNSTKKMSQTSGLVRNTLENFPPAMCAEYTSEHATCEYQEQRNNRDEPPVKFEKTSTSGQGGSSHSSNFAHAEASDAYTITNIDGLQTTATEDLVPTSSVIVTQNEHTSVTEAGHSAEFSAASSSSEPVLNIHTDEKMPPRGKLSEQESVGGNDSCAQVFNENETSTPCDPLARESWETSNGSDADVPPDNNPVPAESTQERKSMLPLKRQLKQQKVFACTACNQKFTCPEERRVHISSLHGSASETSMDKEEEEEEEEEALRKKRKKSSKKEVPNDSAAEGTSKI